MVVRLSQVPERPGDFPGSFAARASVMYSSDTHRWAGGASSTQTLTTAVN